MASIDEYRALISNPYVRKTLDVIASAEGTTGYDTAFGGGKIPGLGTHPGTRHEFMQTDGTKNVTTAAGRYQFIKPTWEGLQKKLGLSDFGPESQDIGAVALLDEAGALDDVLSGNIEGALAKSGKVWASLPSSPYAQPKRSQGFIANALDKAAQAVFPSAQAGELPEQTGATMGFKDKVAKARAAGYSDAEIGEFLSQKPEFAQKVEKARAAGYSDAEIGDFLGIAPTASAAKAAPGETVANPMPLNQENIHTPQAPAADPAAGGGFLSGVGMGAADIVDAGAQMLRRAVPEGVGQAVDALGNRLADAGLPIARSQGVAGVDAIVNKRNADYEAARKAAGRGGFDAARMVGGIAATAPTLALAPAMAGAGLGARVLGGAGMGAAYGAMNPVIGERSQANFTNNKLTQTALGSAFGAAGPLIGRGVSRVLGPKSALAPDVQTLRAAGVELTPGQMMGGAMMKAEDIGMSVPILGGGIRRARERAQAQLNQAVYNRVLEPIGKTTDKLGRAAVDDVSTKVSQAYDDVLAGVKFAPDAQFAQDIGKIQSMVNQGLPQDIQKRFSAVLNREVLEPLSVGRAIDGKAYKNMESALGKEAQQFLHSTDGFQRDLGAAFVEIGKSLKQNLQRANPQHAEKLARVNESFGQLTRLQTAAGKVGAADGIFTPSQLDSAVRMADKTVRKNKYARGDALMQDLSDAARSRMNATIPDSGTAPRTIGVALASGGIGAGLAGLPAVIPAAAGLGVGSLLYSRPAQKVINKILFERPLAAQKLGQQMDRLPAGLLGILAQ